MSPRTKQQFQDIRQQSKDKILISALEIFAEKGYPHSSIDQIAKKAGVAKGSIYHYFESKEAMLQAVIVNGMSEFGGILKIVQSKPSPTEQFEALIQVSFDSVLQNEHFWKLYFSLLTQLSLPKSIKRLFEPMITEMFDFMEQLLEAIGIENPSLESKVLAAIMDGVFLHYLMIGDRYPIEEMKTMIINKYIKK